MNPISVSVPAAEVSSNSSPMDKSVKDADAAVRSIAWLKSIRRPSGTSIRQIFHGRHPLRSAYLAFFASVFACVAAAAAVAFNDTHLLLLGGL